MKSELFGCPTTKVKGSWGGEHRKRKIYGDVPPKMGEFYTKNCKHESHFDPHASKNLKHAGQICKKSVKKIIANIWKMGI